MTKIKARRPSTSGRPCPAGTPSTVAGRCRSARSRVFVAGAAASAAVLLSACTSGGGGVSTSSAARTATTTATSCDDDGDVATGDADADPVDQQARFPVRAPVVTAPADPADPELVRAGHERRTLLFFPAADASTTDDETARHQPSGTAERNASERARLPTRRREGQR